MSDNEKNVAPAPDSNVQTGKSTFRVHSDLSNVPFAGSTHVYSTIINPPGNPGKDRTGPDRDRYKDRVRGKLKGQLGDIIRNNPIFGDHGKIKVPVEGGYEPKWRPGRDGGGGGGNGRKPGSDPADITYIEMTYEEFLELFFESLELPFLLKKMLAQTLVKTQKRRGISNAGPRARLDKRASAIQRLKRAVAAKNAHPEDFTKDLSGLCQEVFEAYVFWAAMTSGQTPVFPEPAREVVKDDTDSFLMAVENAGPEAAQELGFREEILAAVAAYVETNKTSQVPYTFNEVIKEAVTQYVLETVRNTGEIPTVEDVPFHKKDFRYGRIEERDEPDSKAVVFLLLDRSGSMDGEPLAIAKAFFLLNILFLRAKYKHVAIVMIAHDAHAERIMNELDFYKIAAGGGTMATPAYELTLKLANSEFSSAAWNRYMFHATDGMLFDGEQQIQSWWTKIIRPEGGHFNYCGYLEIDPYGGMYRGAGSWDLGGRALLGLPADVKAHVGMSRVASMADLPNAFKEILDKDRVKGA